MTDRGKLVVAVIEGFKTLARQSLINADFGKVSSSGEDLLFAVYKAAVSGVTYTAEEKLTIGPLIPPALQALSYHLFDLQNCFSSHSIDSTRIERSGLQFLVDDFKDFPLNAEDQSQTVEEAIKQFLEQEDIEGLDQRLKTCEFDPYTDDSVRSAGFQAEINKLSSTHWWFSN